MSSYSLIEALGSGRPLLLDGGMGTTMREQSLTASEAHEAFLAAGAENKLLLILSLLPLPLHRGETDPARLLAEVRRTCAGCP